MTGDTDGALYERIQKNLPAEMLEKHRWGILEYEYQPVGKIEPPMWSYTFESIRKQHHTLSMMTGVCGDGLGYCFGGTCTTCKNLARDSDHTNTKGEGKLVMLPDPDIACFVYAGVRDPTTGNLYPHVAADMRREIEETTSAYPNDMLNDEIHVYFKRPKIDPKNIPEVKTFRNKEKTYTRRFVWDKGYVVVTGTQWDGGDA